MPDLFDRLRQETLRAAADNDLPDFMVVRLLAIADHPDSYPGASAGVAALIDMLPLYDTYAQTGYMGMGVSNLILEGAIRRVEAQRILGGD